MEKKIEAAPVTRDAQGWYEHPDLHADISADHRGHRCKVSADICVQNGVARLINLKTGQSTHLSNLASKITKGKQGHSLVLVTPQPLDRNSVFVLGVNCKCRNYDRSDSSNTTKPRRPIRCGQGRPAYPVIATQRQRTSQNHQTKSVNARVEQLHYFFHKEIVA